MADEFPTREQLAHIEAFILEHGNVEVKPDAITEIVEVTTALHTAPLVRAAFDRDGNDITEEHWAPVSARIDFPISLLADLLGREVVDRELHKARRAHHPAFAIGSALQDQIVAALRDLIPERIGA
jgi:hypothetical protein